MSSEHHLNAPLVRRAKGPNFKHAKPTSLYEKIDMDVSEAKEICRDCTMWKFIVSACLSRKQMKRLAERCQSSDSVRRCDNVIKGVGAAHRSPEIT
ncbi:hypothetical protein EVAR_77073_1 [Eumeta japonica]|uniref:Uncharacterized protein n=1 Tax=Eumeta variegata TaxID=151549 RepID=A0A4C1ZYK8_EUMVA|nr:hypothetical protein EVAR_77073_1 [Eumeta japonica]